MGLRWNKTLRIWALNLALFAASSAVTVLVIEGAARVWVKVPPPVELRDGIFVSSLPLINGHPSCRWAPTVAGASLPAAKRPGETRVFVFGESSVQGSPWDYPGSPATMLRDRLAERLPGRSITVVNMGRSCASMMDSYYYLLSAAAYRPDVVVFYQGSNDRFDADRERCLPASRPALHAAWRFLAARSRALWAARALAPQSIRRWEDRAVGAPMPPGTPRCDPDEAFARWTRILIGTAKDMGARVVVTSPVRNPLLPVELKAWTPKPSSVGEQIKGLDAPYRGLLRCELTPGCAPDRLIPGGTTEIDSRAEAWKASAAAAGVRFVDFRSRLIESAPRGKSRGRFFVGETHLTLEGYWLLSSLWASAIEDVLSGREPSAEKPAQPSVTGYADDLLARGSPVGLTLYREGLAYARARMLLLAVPSLQKAAELKVADAQLVLAGLRKEVGLPAAVPAGLQASWVRFDLDAHLKRPPEPNVQAPPGMPPDMRAALDSFAAGDLQKTELAVKLVLVKDPANVTGLLMRGSVYLHTKRLDQALEDFNTILRLPPGRPEVLADALSNRGQTLDQLGRKSEAEKDYTHCLSVAPPNWSQRAAVAALLVEARRAP